MADRLIDELPEIFADEPEAQQYIDEAIEKAKAGLAQSGMEGLLETGSETED